jgi:hypothetical protein
MVELWLMPPLEEDRSNTFIFQENGTPHFHHTVPVSLKNHFPGRWSGRGWPTVWPCRSPSSNSYFLFSGVGGYVNIRVYTPHSALKLPYTENTNSRWFWISWYANIVQCLEWDWYNFERCRITSGTHNEMRQVANSEGSCSCCTVSLLWISYIFWN